MARSSRTTEQWRRPCRGRVEVQEEGLEGRHVREFCRRTKCRNPGLAVRLNATRGRGDHFLLVDGNDHGLRLPGRALGNEFLPKKQPSTRPPSHFARCNGSHATEAQVRESRDISGVLRATFSRLAEVDRRFLVFSCGSEECSIKCRKRLIASVIDVGTVLVACEFCELRRRGSLAREAFPSRRFHPD